MFFKNASISSKMIVFIVSIISKQVLNYFFTCLIEWTESEVHQIGHHHRQPIGVRSYVF